MVGNPGLRVGQKRMFMQMLLIAPMPLAATLPMSASAKAEICSTAQTPIRSLLGDPAAKAVIAKYFPEFVASRAVAGGQANRFTIHFVKRFRPSLLTAERLAAADAELAKLPVL